MTNADAPYEQSALDVIAQGDFTLPEIQTLHDALLAEGSVGLNEALFVGCKVEVTDIMT